MDYGLNCISELNRLSKPIHGAAGAETDLGGGKHHPTHDAVGDEDEQEGQQPGKQCNVILPISAA